MAKKVKSIGLFYKFRHLDTRTWRRHLRALMVLLNPSELNVMNEMWAGDDVARLAFADICEERSEMYLARFVREQFVCRKHDRDRDSFPRRRRRSRKTSFPGS